MSTLTHAARDIRNAPIPSLPVELAILEWIGGDIVLVEDDLHTSEVAITPKPKKEEVTKEPQDSKSVVEEIVVASKKNVAGADDLLSVWPDILQAIKPYNHTLEALLKGCQPGDITDNVITLHFKFKFHKEKIEDMQNKRIVEEVIEKVTGRSFTISCVLNPEVALTKRAFHGSDEVSDEITREKSPSHEANSAPKTKRNPGTMHNAKGTEAMELAIKELGGTLIE
jgi:hypothetical protein